MRDILEQAWHRHARQWQAYAHKLAGSPDAAGDAVQDAIARTMRADPAFATPMDAHRYVMCAIRTSAYRGWQYSARTAPLDDHDAGSAETPLDLVLTDEGTLKNALRVRRALRSMRDLPPPVRRAIELRFLHKPPMTLREIGQVEGCPLTTIQSRIQSGLRTIAATIRPDDDAR